MKKINKFHIAIFTLLVNISYSFYNMILGISTHSWWFTTIGVHYSFLSLMRFAVLTTKKKIHKKKLRTFTGAMLMITSLPLAGMVILTSFKDRGVIHHEIVMITIALYTFTKITLATLNLVKSRNNKISVTINTLNHISFADAAVSIFALQRSMLVSFEGMPENEIRIFNIVVGSVVCMIVFALGIGLLKKVKRSSLKIKSP